MNLDRFRNKQIMHVTVELSRLKPSASLPKGTVFLDSVEVSADHVHLVALYEMEKELRNFKFLIVEDQVGLHLPYNFRYVGSKIFPDADGHAHSVSVYVEKEL